MGFELYLIQVYFISLSLHFWISWPRGKIIRFFFSLWWIKYTKGCSQSNVIAHVRMRSSVWEKETGVCSGTPVHVPVTGCRLHGSSTGLARGHLAAKERCPSWPRSNWIAAIGLATRKLSFSFINTEITSDIPRHPAGPLNGHTVKLENH